MNSVLSSTKDNSIQHNNNKKKFFLNSKIPTHNQIIKNINNTNNNITNENSIRHSQKKQKLILPNNAIYEGYLIENSFYRRADLSNQGKCILLYNQGNEYDFTKEEQNERGHVPFINGMRYSDVVGSDCSKTTYGLVKYNAPVRLYHYHIKSLDDWKHKLARGSAANTAQIYDEDITKNKWYGDYSVIDLTMLNTAKKIGLL